MQNTTTLEIKLQSTGSNSDSTTTTDDYDHVGAMQFIVATILVYSIIGVCCTLVVRIKRSHNSKSHAMHAQDEHIQKYLKEEKYLKQDGFRMKLSFDCEKTKERLDDTAGRIRLLDIQKSVTCPDFGVKDKRRKKKRRKTRLDSLVGKMGFTLLYVPEVNDDMTGDFEMNQNFEVIQNGYITSSASSNISETPCHSLSSVTEASAPVQNSSYFLPLDQTYLYEDDCFSPVYLSCSSSAESLEKTIKEADVNFKECCKHLENRVLTATSEL